MSRLNVSRCNTGGNTSETNVSSNTNLSRGSQLLVSDNGAVAILITLFFSSLVVVGILALVVDVGSIYQERRVLQNVADATALAIGQDCSEGNKLGYCASFPVSQHPASQYVSRNSDDGISRILEVCGNGYGLSSCSPSERKTLSCEPINSTSTNFVRVRIATETKETSNNGLLKYVFGNALESGQSGIQIRACAQVAFGVAVSAPVVYPLILSICGYQDLSTPMIYLANQEDMFKYVLPTDPVPYVENNLVLDTNPSSTTFNRYITLYQYDSVNAGKCRYKPIGSSWVPTDIDQVLIQDKLLDGMGLFNCVGRNLSTDCISNDSQRLCPTVNNPVTISIGDFVNKIPPGNSQDIPNNCETQLRNMGYSGNVRAMYFDYLNDKVINKPVYIPVYMRNFKDSSGNLVRGKLQVSHFFTVIIKGISLGSIVQAGETPKGPAIDDKSWPTKKGCTSDSYCIYGNFTRSTPPIVPPKNRNENQPNTGVGYVYLIP